MGPSHKCPSEIPALYDPQKCALWLWQFINGKGEILRRPLFNGWEDEAAEVRNCQGPEEKINICCTEQASLWLLRVRHPGADLWGSQQAEACVRQPGLRGHMEVGARPLPREGPSRGGGHLVGDHVTFYGVVLCWARCSSSLGSVEGGGWAPDCWRRRRGHTQHTASPGRWPDTRLASRVHPEAQGDSPGGDGWGGAVLWAVLPGGVILSCHRPHGTSAPGTEGSALTQDQNTPELYKGCLLPGSQVLLEKRGKGDT